MEARTVIEFGELTMSKKKEVLEQLREEVMRPIVMEAIDLHENIKLFLSNVDEGALERSLTNYGEHHNFDSEFEIEEIPNQHWYNLCNGILYLNDMVKAIQKVNRFIQGYKVDIKDLRVYLKVIAFIKEDSDFLYSEIKKELCQKNYAVKFDMNK